MIKTLKTIALLACVLMLALTSCADKPKPAAKPAGADITKTTAKHELPNYRYVDIDTVLSRYNLAKDYNEEIMRMQNNMESSMRRHQNTIQSKASKMQNKMQNNGYLSEASYRADEQELARLQDSAQKDVDKLQADFQNAAMKAQQTVNDSIEAFIKVYNEAHGYDAILLKNATLYINPELDITEEVIEGLNAKYNKVKK